MKKIFENLYIFSKLTLSLTLLICLIITLYILYVNYNNENKLSQNDINLENKLKTEINKNTEIISKISENIQNNEIKLEEIKKSISKLTIKDKRNDNITLNQNIESLNKNFNKLSEEINNLKENDFLIKEAKKPVIIDESINDIIDLIMIKYENNIKFDQELDYLRKTIDNNKITNIEKITIISLDAFKGHKYLEEIFNKEVSVHLKKISNTNQNSFISKIFLPYVSISPSSENTITNDFILKIKGIKLNIENNNIEKAYKNLRTINEHNNIFKSSLYEMDKYIKFKKELYGLL